MNDFDPAAGSGGHSVQLSTKLSAPAIRSQLIDRSALLGTLSGEPRRKLTLLSAPAGWGKTTLLGQWLSAGGQDQFGWLTLDSSDNDTGRFWTCVLTAIGTASRGVGAEAFDLLALGADHIRVVVPTLLNELAAMSRRIVLILDDYHLVENPEVHEELGYLIEHSHQFRYCCAAEVENDGRRPLLDNEVLQWALQFRRAYFQTAAITRDCARTYPGSPSNSARRSAC